GETARSGAARPAAALPEALEAAKARLAFGIDLTAIKRLALVVVAKDLVGGVELGEFRRRVLVALVGVGVQLLGKLAVGALDRRLARILWHPQDAIGVAHFTPLRKSAGPPERQPYQPLVGHNVVGVVAD